MCARYAGIDYGTKRAGIAVSDPVGVIASPLTTVRLAGTPIDHVHDIIASAAEFDIDEWVVGQPLNMDGTEGPQARLTARFAELLARVSQVPVHQWDERLSSLQADAHLAAGELTRKQRKSRRDKLAAQIILQCFLDARSARD